MRARKLSSPFGAARRDDPAAHHEGALVEHDRLARSHSALGCLEAHLDQIAPGLVFARRPIPQAHTIWELVLHIAVWESVVRRRLAGEVVQPSPEQDWPPVLDTSEAAWKNTLAELERGHRQLRQSIAALNDDRLKDRVPGKDDSVYVLLHGLIQHDLYHAGQIALLKKALIS